MKKKNPSRARAISTLYDGATITIPPPPSGNRKDKIAYYHSISQSAGQISIMAAIAAGIELQMAKAEIEHGQFRAWMQENLQFSERTAQRYMALAEIILGDVGMPRLLEMPEEERREKIASASSSVDAKSLTQLYLDLGLVSPPERMMGGARPGAGRPRKDDALSGAQAELAIAIEQSQSFASQLTAWAIDDDAMGMLPDEVLSAWLRTLDDVLKRGRDILQGRKVSAKARAN